jgi:hypothetical protein
MGLLDTIVSANGGNAISQIAKQLGLPESLANQAVSALAPALSKGLQRETSKPGGLDSLLGALSGGQHQKYIEQPEVIGQQSSIDDGNAILGHILGSKDVSRNVAGAASQSTGIDSGVLKQMLPMLATVAMGALSKQTKGGAAAGASGNPLGQITQLFDDQDDGSGPSTDELLNLAKKFF